MACQLRRRLVCSSPSPSPLLLLLLLCVVGKCWPPICRLGSSSMADSVKMTTDTGGNSRIVRCSPLVQHFYLDTFRRFVVNLLRQTSDSAKPRLRAPQAAYSPTDFTLFSSLPALLLSRSLFFLQSAHLQLVISCRPSTGAESKQRHKVFSSLWTRFASPDSGRRMEAAGLASLSNACARASTSQPQATSSSAYCLEYCFVLLPLCQHDPNFDCAFQLRPMDV